MRKPICQVLGFNKSTFYYQPRINASEEVLRAEIQRLAAAYPTYGYRRITKLLATKGHTVGYKRVARLMKEDNLSVSVKRVCQTTHSTDSPQPWRNHLKTLEVCRCDQVWVGDITYVHLKHRFIYVACSGCPWENGYTERLIRTLKEEEVHLNDYQDITDARERIGHFITQVYHEKRPHSALGYLTPMEFQQKNLS